MKDVVRKILDKFDPGGNGFTDIRLQNSQSLTIQFQNGLMKDVISTRVGGAAARALVNGAWGFAATTDVSPESLEQILKSAISMAQVASLNVKEPRRISDKFVYEGNAILEMDIDPRDVSIEEKIAITSGFEKNIRLVDDRIALSSAEYTEGINSETILSSTSTEVTTESGVFRLLGKAMSRDGGLQKSVSADVASSVGLKNVLEFNTTERGEKLGQRAIQLLSAAKAPSGKMDIIMDPSLVGIFIHEAFGHASEADDILTKRSILADKLDTRVGIEEITVRDDPTLPGLRGSYSYDSEGTLARPRILIKDGIMTEYFHTLETATMLEMEPNGSGRAMTFNFPPIARMGNTFIDKGDKTLEELFEIIKNGIYLTNTYGGRVMPDRGMFTFSSQYGYIIKNGEQEDLTQNVSISGMTLEVLENIMGVGKDLKYNFNGTCGKRDQWAPVTGGGPPIAVRDIVVGGR